MPKDKTETNALIIRCMKEEFLTHGYEKASLNNISANVGITTAGLYRHFNGKADMFRRLVQSTLDDFKELSDGNQAQPQAYDNHNPFDANWAEFWTDFFLAHKDGMKLLVCCSSGSAYESFEEDLIHLEAEGNKRYAEALRALGKTPREVNDMQWHMLATAYVHLVLEIVRHDMTRKEALKHMHFVGDLLYPGWRKLLGLEGV